MNNKDLTKVIEIDEAMKSNIISLFCYNDFKTLRLLPFHTYNLNYLVEDKDIQFDKYISPLLAACYIGRIEILNLLLSNDKIDVNLASMSEGFTPIMVACFKGYYEIVRMLVERNADVNKCNKLNQTPLLFCFSRIEEYRYKYENKKICMMMIDILLRNGANIDVRIDNKVGYTVLMKLVSTDFTDRDRYENIVEIIQFLLERGASKQINTFDGRSLMEIIKPTPYKKELISVIVETKQTIFYEPVSQETRMKRTQEVEFNDLNEMRPTCCNIY